MQHTNIVCGLTRGGCRRQYLGPTGPTKVSERSSATAAGFVAMNQRGAQLRDEASDDEPAEVTLGGEWRFLREPSDGRPLGRHACSGAGARSSRHHPTDGCWRTGAGDTEPKLIERGRRRHGLPSLVDQGRWRRQRYDLIDDRQRHDEAEYGGLSVSEGQPADGQGQPHAAIVPRRHQPDRTKGLIERPVRLGCALKIVQFVRGEDQVERLRLQHRRRVLGEQRRGSELDDAVEAPTRVKRINGVAESRARSASHGRRRSFAPSVCGWTAARCRG